MKIGDWVWIDNNVMGEIVMDRSENTATGRINSYLVKVDNEDNTSTQDWYAESSLEVSPALNHGANAPICSCGLKYDRNGGRHQNYCELDN